tara:strand:+ start:1123 stop:2250 length:1128 start_codon:yes stop_codon:yes gene_type:complete
MKVLYLGHYKEGTGWAQAAIDATLAMDRVGIEVVPRNINLTGVECEVPESILRLEKNSVNGAEYCIQHLLPHHLVGTGRFKKNVARFEGETINIGMQPWLVHMSQMDEVWVPNKHSWSSLIDDGLFVNNGIKVVPHPTDLIKFVGQSEQRIDIPNINNTFKFYYIGDLNERKNLVSVIKCFHSEFDLHDDVSLIIKVKKFGQAPEDTVNDVNSICSAVKSRLRMYGQESYYRPEIVIGDNIPEESVKTLHQYGDCFVCPSHGEAWSIPSFEAMAFGKTPICSNFGGPVDFIDANDKNTGTLVDGQLSICDCPDAAFPEILTGRELWFDPSEVGIKKAMRYYYQNRNSIDRKAGLRRAKDFSYESVGEKIKEFLNE